MDINKRASLALERMLSLHGFDVIIEQNVPSASDFDDIASTWTTVATVRAVWVSTGSGDTSLKDGRPSSKTKTSLYISYRSDLSSTDKVSGKRVVVNNNPYTLQSSTVEGDKVGLILSVGDGHYIGS